MNNQKSGYIYNTSCIQIQENGVTKCTHTICNLRSTSPTSFMKENMKEVRNITIIIWG